MILTYASLSVPLPDYAEWTDRYNWSPVVRKEDYGCGDGEAAPLIVDVFVLATGRPITLRFPYLQRAALEELLTLSALPGVDLTLSMVGEPERTVQFRGSDPIQAQESYGRVPATAEDYFTATLNLIEVS